VRSGEGEWLDLCFKPSTAGSWFLSASGFPDTVLEYRKAHPEFQAMIDQAQADQCDQVEKHLLAACERLNVAAIIFYLTNRSPDRWRDRRNTAKVEIT
jgi:hypothetical protein